MFEDGTVTDKTFDYEGESAAPRPVSHAVGNYLRKSISISDMLRRLLRGWYFALIGALIGVAIGIFVIWITPPSYTVTVKLMPLDGSSADIGGGGGIGLDILSGLLGSSGSVPKFTRFVASFNTIGLATRLDSRYDAICTVFNCNKKTRQWPRYEGFYAWINRAVTSISHLPNPDHPRTAADLANYIEANVIPSSDRNTKMLVLSMNTNNEKQASRFLVELVTAANDYIKEQDNAVVKTQVAYVTQQLKTNTDVAQRDVLIKMLEEQEQHLMLTAVNLPYVASIQDGPTVTVTNSAIKYLAAFTLFGFLIGGAVGILLSFVPENKRFWRSPWKKY